MQLRRRELSGGVHTSSAERCAAPSVQKGNAAREALRVHPPHRLLEGGVCGFDAASRKRSNAISQNLSE